MNCSPKSYLLLPACALLWSLLGVSCAVPEYFGGAPGGGYYINQVSPYYRPERHKPRWGEVKIQTRASATSKAPPAKKAPPAPKTPSTSKKAPHSLKALFGPQVPVPASAADTAQAPATPPAPAMARPHKRFWSFLGFGPRIPRSAIPRDDSFWKGDNIPGSPSLRINLTEQRVYFYKGGQLVGMSPISSGREGFGTTVGHFQIMEKDLDHKSTWYGEYVTSDGDVMMHEVDNRKDACPPGCKFDGANMRYFMRINGPIGMHEGYLPGYAASHGCIRLPSHMASAFYEATPVGTPVEIVR